MPGTKIIPPKLSTDKSVGIIAPADPVLGVCPEKTVHRGYTYLREKGFNVVEGDSMKQLGHKHTAGSPQLRVNDIHNFVKDDTIGCIMAFWGGFNSNQLLDHLDYDLIKSNPKIFIGYSDFTAITTAISVKTGLVTFSGPGTISFAKPEPFDYTWEYFNKLCLNPSPKLTVEPSNEYADDLYFLRTDDNRRIKQKNIGPQTINTYIATGDIIAGNLQTLLLLTGTSYEPDYTDKIVFIEEDETSTPPLIDRFLMQAKQLGWFDKIKGLVIGRFTAQTGFSPEDTQKELLESYFSDANFPVIYNADFGHSDPLFTIPNNGTATVNGETKSITFEQAVK